MSNTPITGGCHCGAVRYTLDGELGFSFACYCTSCRKLSAGAHLAGVAVKPDAFTLDGTLSEYSYQGGKAEVVLQFCPTCGTHVTALPKAYPGMISLRIGTLDQPEAIAKLKKLYTEEACHWEPGLNP